MIVLALNFKNTSERVARASLLNSLLGGMAPHMNRLIVIDLDGPNRDGVLGILAAMVHMFPSDAIRNPLLEEQ